MQTYIEFLKSCSPEEKNYASYVYSIEEEITESLKFKALDPKTRTLFELTAFMQALEDIRSSYMDELTDGQYKEPDRKLINKLKNPIKHAK